MAYIESHQELGRHPKTRKAARLLGISIPCAVGTLHLLWHWALAYAQDGDLTHYDPADIADAVFYEGDPMELLHALEECRIGPDSHGFLERTDDGRLVLHDWDQYAGKLVEKRKTDAERKREERERLRLLREAQDTVPPPPPPAPARPQDVQRTSNGRRADGAGNRTEPTAAERSVEQQSVPDSAVTGLTNPTAAADTSRAGAREESPPVAAAVDLPSAGGEAADQLAARLHAQGMNRADAARLAKLKSDECRRQLDYLPFVDFGTGEGQYRGSPGKYLRCAIDEGWGPPRRWQEREEKAARQGQSEAQAAARREREERESREAQEREAMLDAQIAAIKAADPAGWERIEAQAASAVPKAIKPTSPAYPAALRRAIQKALPAAAQPQPQQAAREMAQPHA